MEEKGFLGKIRTNLLNNLSSTLNLDSEFNFKVELRLIGKAVWLMLRQ